MSPIIAPELARQHFHAMETGDMHAAASVVHPEHINHMAGDHPPASSHAGLAGFAATSAWLRLAFSELHFELVDLLHDDERTIAHVIMSGTQTGPFVLFPPGAKPVSFPQTGRSFAARQCHLFRRADGLHLDHTAVRDDLGMMQQLGHLPPSPAVAFHMARWNLSGGHRRATQRAINVTEAAASAWTSNTRST